MWKGIELVRPDLPLGDIGAAIQRHAESRGFSVVREFCGHGIGKRFHEEPQILHYGRAGQGLKLVPGMPSSIRAPLPVSTSEWIASLSIAELPVMAAAANFVAATSRLPTRAA